MGSRVHSWSVVETELKPGLCFSLLCCTASTSVLQKALCPPAPETPGDELGKLAGVPWWCWHTKHGSRTRSVRILDELLFIDFSIPTSSHQPGSSQHQRNPDKASVTDLRSLTLKVLFCRDRISLTPTLPPYDADRLLRLRLGSVDQGHRYHPGACGKLRISGPTCGPLNQNLQFQHIPRRSVCTSPSEKPRLSQYGLGCLPPLPLAPGKGAPGEGGEVLGRKGRRKPFHPWPSAATSSRPELRSRRKPVHLRPHNHLGYESVSEVGPRGQTHKRCGTRWPAPVLLIAQDCPLVYYGLKRLLRPAWNTGTTDSMSSGFSVLWVSSNELQIKFWRTTCL